MYSPNAALPNWTATNTEKASPQAIHTADSVSASRGDGS
jgi:hypothetical protein